MALACDECGTGLADDQRYCLVCGARSPLATPAPLAAAPPAAEPVEPVLAADAIPAPVAAAAPRPPAGPLGRLSAAAGTMPLPAPLARVADDLAAASLRVRLPGTATVTEVPSSIAAAAVLATLFTGVALGSLGGTQAQADDRINVALNLPPAQSLPPAPITSAPPIQAAPDLPAAVDPAPVAPVAPEPVAPEPEPVAPEPEPEPAPQDEPAAPEKPEAPPSPVDRVLVVALNGQAPDALFGPAAPPYLKELAAQGVQLTEHHAVGTSTLSNGIALLAGQAPTRETLQNCPAFAPVRPADAGEDGQELGAGCGLSIGTTALTSQLELAGKDWKVAVEGLPAPCPQPVDGQPDVFEGRNPTQYLAAISGAENCKDDVVGFDHLANAYADEKTAPAFMLVAPGACHDGRDAPCPTGEPTGVAALDTWLQAELKPALEAPGLQGKALVILTGMSGAPGDTSGAGFPESFPNAPEVAPGGGHVGGLLLGAGLLGGTYDKPTNHFTLLRMIEDVLGLDPLGFAASKDAEGLKTALFGE
jgi:hypothetical protein